MLRSFDHTLAGRPDEAFRQIHEVMQQITGATAMAPAPELPAGATFERLHHEGAHGARDYLLYRPAERGRPISGVILMLHGCTQSAEDFAAGTRMNAHAEEHGLVIIYPEQTHDHNAQRCWNWFRPGDQGSEGEPALLAELAASIALDHDVPSSRVFAAGLSSGGSMAAILGQTNPDALGAVGVHSGLAPGSASNVLTAFDAMNGNPSPDAEALRVPAIIFHGSADDTVAPVNAERLAGLLGDAEPVAGETNGRKFERVSAESEAGHPVELWTVDGTGHAWSGGTATAASPIRRARTPPRKWSASSCPAFEGGRGALPSGPSSLTRSCMAPIDRWSAPRLPRRLRWLGHAAAMGAIVLVLPGFVGRVWLPANQVVGRVTARGQASASAAGAGASGASSGGLSGGL